MIRRGFHAELDELRNLSQHSKQIIASMEERETQTHRHRLAENSLQSDFRLLHRNFQSQSASRARRLRTQADSGQCRALHFSGAKGLRTKDSRRRRTHRGNRTPTFRRDSLRHRGSKPHAFAATAGAVAQLDVLAASQNSPPTAATRAPNSTDRRTAHRRRPPPGHRRTSAPKRRALRSQRSCTSNPAASNSCSSPDRTWAASPPIFAKPR